MDIFIHEIAFGNIVCKMVAVCSCFYVSTLILPRISGTRAWYKTVQPWYIMQKERCLHSLATCIWIIGFIKFKWFRSSTLKWGDCNWRACIHTERKHINWKWDTSIKGNSPNASNVLITKPSSQPLMIYHPFEPRWILGICFQSENKYWLSGKCFWWTMYIYIYFTLFKGA